MKKIFEVEKKDPASSARTGTLVLAHGIVRTPAFMPVGTRGFIKTLTTEEVASTGAEMLLANAYHLFLRPGHLEVLRQGKIQKFMRFNGPVLTDSGGFQIFSLSHKTKVTDEGAAFYSIYDGSKHFLTPENAMDVQTAIGADVIMAFDECVSYDTPKAQIKEAFERTIKWSERALKHLKEAKPDSPWPQYLFGITQGGVHEDLRRESTLSTVALDLKGYAIGGLSVGEPLAEMLPMIELSDEVLPKDRPRYLMGVGDPESILESVARGIDMFDCVLPTRIARNGTVFTRSGRINLKVSANRTDDGPLDPTCKCFVCKEYSRSYLRHMFSFKEVLSLRLLSYHNLFYMQALMRDIRGAIDTGDFGNFKNNYLAEYGAGHKD